MTSQYNDTDQQHCILIKHTINPARKQTINGHFLHVKKRLHDLVSEETRPTFDTHLKMESDKPEARDFVSNEHSSQMPGEFLLQQKSTA